MKLHAHRLSRKGDKVTLLAKCTNRFRRPAHLKITFDEIDERDEQVILSDDIAEASGIINALGEIAWSHGWRPAGLVQAVGGTILGYKLTQPVVEDKPEKG